MRGYDAFNHQMMKMLWTLLIVSLGFPTVSSSASAGPAYVYTTNWFVPNIPVWEKTFEPLKGKSNLKYLEIGAFEGRSFFWMMDNILTDKSARGTVVDVFPSKLRKNSISTSLSTDKRKK